MQRLQRSPYSIRDSEGERLVSLSFDGQDNV